MYTQDNIPGMIRLPRGQKAGERAAPFPHFEEVRICTSRSLAHHAQLVICCGTYCGFSIVLHAARSAVQVRGDPFLRQADAPQADLPEADAANDETFGDAMVPVEPFGDFAVFSHGAGGGGKAPQAGDEASDAFLENLVEQCIEGGDGDGGKAGGDGGRGGGAGGGQGSLVDDDDDDQEEIILFRPTGRGAESKLQQIPGGIGLPASGGGMWEGDSFQIAASNVSGGLWGPASPLAGLNLPTASGAQAGLRDGCENAEFPKRIS
jgi:hypothetical protein